MILIHSVGICHLVALVYQGFFLNFLKITFLATLFGLGIFSVTPVLSAEFVLSDTLSRTHKLSDYRGKWVIVNYWATWCPPCLEEMPSLVALYDARKHKDVMVFGVAFGYESKQEVLAYADDMLVSYPIVLGDEAAIKQIGKADVLPTTYIYNPRGDLVKIKRGLVSKQSLEELMSSTGQNTKSTK
jgi:thiol-disulfide isomerase/thioredoxin